MKSNGEPNLLFSHVRNVITAFDKMPNLLQQQIKRLFKLNILEMAEVS